MFGIHKSQVNHQNMMVNISVHILLSIHILDFVVLYKCHEKMNCLLNKMLFVRDLKPTLSMKTDPITAILFT